LTFEEPSSPCEVLTILPHMYVIWNENIIWDEVEGHMIAMDNYTGKALTIPDEAREMWKLCSGEKSVGEILSIFYCIFKFWGPPYRCAKDGEDYSTVIGKWLCEGFIQIGFW
jgi:hypothetical protein